MGYLSPLLRVPPGEIKVSAGHGHSHALARWSPPQTANNLAASPRPEGKSLFPLQISSFRKDPVPLKGSPD